MDIVAKVGFILLAHRNANRVAGLAEFLTAQGAQLAIHLDAKMHEIDRLQITSRLDNNPDIHFVPSRKIEWGQWSIVEATIEGTKLLTDAYPDITHFYNISGTCVPLRPLAELIKFLDGDGRDADHIESITVGDNNWVVGGLESERVELYHPFDWKKQRRLFDASVNIQRRLGIKRRTPETLIFSFGSQWWCLRRETLAKILGDPEIERYSRFFSRSWIPDESFFQTLSRKHSDNIIPESPTFAKFDHFGSPFIFYDDHLEQLKGLDAFFVRKVWSGANDIYDHFLDPKRENEPVTAKSRIKLDDRLNQVIEHANLDRTGLVSQFTRPTRHYTHFRARRRYHIFVGFDQFKKELAKFYVDSDTIKPYGTIFDPKEVELKMSPKGRGRIEESDKTIRDYAPEQYLQQLIWFNPQFEIAFPTKAHWIRKIGRHIVADPQANIIMLRGAWILDLAKRNFSDAQRLRNNARVQINREQRFLSILEKPYRKATVQIVELGDWLSNQNDAKHVMPEGFRPLRTKVNLRAIQEFAHRLEAEGIATNHYNLDLLDQIIPPTNEQKSTAE